MRNEKAWDRLPKEVGVFAMRNAYNHGDCQEIKVVLAVLSEDGGLTEINAYDAIGAFNGYHGEYKKLRAFDLSKPEEIDVTDLRTSQLVI